MTINISTLWKECLEQLQTHYKPQEFNTWIRPLQPEMSEKAENVFLLLAPNKFVVDWVRQNYFEQITTILAKISQGKFKELCLRVGSKQEYSAVAKIGESKNSSKTDSEHLNYYPKKQLPLEEYQKKSKLNAHYTFDKFVEGKSNQLARAASLKVAKKT